MKKMSLTIVIALVIVAGAPKKAEAGILEGALIGGAIGAVVGLVIHLSKSSGKKEDAHSEDINGEEVQDENITEESESFKEAPLEEEVPVNQD